MVNKRDVIEYLEYKIMDDLNTEEEFDMYIAYVEGVNVFKTKIHEKLLRELIREIKEEYYN